MSRQEWVEGLAIIGVIVAWWPLIFLGWTAVAYRVVLYVGSFAILGFILVRRLQRLEEAFRYSRKIIEQQQLTKYGPKPPLSLYPGKDKAGDSDEADKNS